MPLACTCLSLCRAHIHSCRRTTWAHVFVCAHDVPTSKSWWRNRPPRRVETRPPARWRKVTRVGVGVRHKACLSVPAKCQLESASSHFRSTPVDPAVGLLSFQCKCIMAGRSNRLSPHSPQSGNRSV